jgi:hypothetical protein
VRIGLGLGPDGGQRGVRGARQPAEALGGGQRVLVQARVGQHQRDATLGASRRELGPDLGLHQHADAGLEAVQEAGHCGRGVPGLPDLQVAFFQQLGALFPAGGGAVGEQDRDAGVLAPQLGDQDAGGARLAQRDRMNPAPAGAGRGLVIPAETLLDRMGVAGLGDGAPAQLAPHQRLRESGEDAVEAQQQRTHAQQKKSGFNARLRPASHRASRP